MGSRREILDLRFGCGMVGVRMWFSDGPTRILIGGGGALRRHTLAIK